MALIYAKNIMIDDFKVVMKTKFEIENLDLMEYFLRIQVICLRDFHMSMKLCYTDLKEIHDGQMQTSRDTYCNKNKTEQVR